MGSTRGGLLMDVVAEILAERRYGFVHCGVSGISSPTLAELATEFSLDPGTSNYDEIDAPAANRLCELILHQDLAYNMEMMPAPRASELARRFLALFGTDGVRFFTNGTFHESPQGPRLTYSQVSWHSVTSATFDTGVLILGPRLSGCLWVEDED